MGFLANCTNKGCYKQNEPYLDSTTNQAFCSVCNKEITNLTSFAKNQMKANKQFRKSDPVSFSVKCNNCKSTDRPKIEKDKVLCKSCSKEITHLSSNFANMLKEFLKKADEII